VPDILFVVGRLLFGGLFLYNGINHFTNFATTKGYTAYKGVPMPEVATVLSGLWLVISGASVVAGFRPEIGLYMIALFLLGVTPKMHDFWNAHDAQARMGEFINFTKNMAMLGAALALLAVPRPWPMSLG
jgi:putative oxidoreductase